MAANTSFREYHASEVIEAFKSNDNHVLAAVYKAHFPNVRHFIVQNSGEEDDAKDIYQEAVLALWNNIKLGKLDNDSNTNIGGYIFQVARHKWLDKLKSKQHKSTMRLVRDEQPDQVDTGLDDSAQREAQIERLLNLMAKLGDTCKSILRKFYYEKMSLEEIGGDLNYDAATLRTKKYRCMMQLRKMHEND